MRSLSLLFKCDVAQASEVPKAENVLTQDNSENEEEGVVHAKVYIPDAQSYSIDVNGNVVGDGVRLRAAI